MEWTKTIVRKEIITKESTTEISHERCTFIRKMESALNTSIKETHIIIGRTGNEGNQHNNETSSRGIGMNGSGQHDTENNFVSDERLKMIENSQLDNVNADSEHEELEHNCTRSQTTDPSVHLDENLDFCLNELNNSKISIRKRKGVCHSSMNSDDHLAKKVFKNPAMPLKKYMTEKSSPESNDQSIKQKNYGTEDNIVENNRKTKSDNLKDSDTNFIIESQSVMGRIANEKDKFRNENSSRDIGMDYCQQGMKNNFVSDNNTNMNENCELDNVNANREHEEIEENGKISQTTDASVNLNECLDLSGSELDSSKKYSIKCNAVSQAITNSDGHLPNEIFKNEAKPLKKYLATEKLPKFHNLTNEKKNSGIKDNIVKTLRKEKSHKPKNENINDDKVFSYEPLNEKDKPTLRSKVNFFSDIDLFKIPYHSKDMISKNDKDDYEKTEVGKKIYQVENLPPTKRGDIKNIFKKCGAYITQSKNEIKRNEFEVQIISKSVSDLITFFESLNSLKQSDVKHPDVISKRKPSEFKQVIKNEHVVHVNKNIKCNANPSSSGPQMLNISYNIGDKEGPLEKTQSLETMTNGILPNEDKPLFQSTLSPNAAFVVCDYCKGNCVHFEKSENCLERNVKNIKEHIFIFSDNVLRETEPSKTSHCRRFRRQLLRKNNKPNNAQTSVKLPDAKNDDKANLSINSNKTKEDENLCDVNRKQIAIETGVGVNRLSLQQNAIQGDGPQENDRTERMKPERITNVKGFIGILLLVIIIIIIYDRIAANCNLY